MHRGAALVAAVAFLAYVQSLGFGFIYDDYWTVVGNEHLQKSFRTLVRGALSGNTVRWGMPDATRPLMGISLWFDRGLFGLSAAGHHLHSVLLYMLVCVIVFALGFALLRSFAGALAAGLVFAVAPLHSEVAAAINYREDLLAAIGVFGGAALAFWPAPQLVRSRPYMIGALWLYALLGKESAIVAPLLWAALWLWRRPPRATLQSTLPLALGVVGIAWLNWRFGLSVLGEQIPRADYASWGERCLRTARFEVLSVVQSFLPLRARPEFDPPIAAHWGWSLALVALLALGAGLALSRRTRRLAALLAVALAAPLASCPLVAPANELADRYWFFGSLVAALLVGQVVHAVSRRREWVAAVGLSLLVLAGITATRSAASVWESEVSLWTFAVSTAPHSPRAWTSLSRAHRMAGQEELAEKTVERALDLRRDYVPGQVARALNYLSEGHFAEGRGALKAIEPQTQLHRDALRVAARCAAQPDALQAQKCVEDAVPYGLVLGDPEQLRVRSEQLLAHEP